ncbi:MAG: hypothetical protein JRF02_09200 [Deltaproteobacteria bacterium]|jgi:hypothetical protein|nr:hypothetical protein [Deltaproteobacteria bacterium]
MLNFIAYELHHLGGQPHYVKYLKGSLLMSMKNIALCVGLFSTIMGLLTYDPEIKTAAVPVITGIIVIILALCGLIPEFTVCKRCGKKSIGPKEHCPYCKDEE